MQLRTEHLACMKPVTRCMGKYDAKALFTTLLLLVYLVLAFATSTHAATPFTTNGNFSVGSDGSANYTIPIQAPPGTAGMAPTLSLNYNSNGGNGTLGLGWGLDGLSQISRCGRTIVQDGANGGVSYNSNDKLCIDGQRLISTGGTYGTSGTEYRTELANFAKIISYGAAGNGPAYFKVWTKAGQVVEYGNTTDSRIEAAGIATVRTWGVNKISDTKGNYINITYVEDNANGEAYISRIDYTGNASSTPVLTPYASVQFVYETRPDTTTDYIAGYILKKTKRISNVKTFIGATLIKDYRITYSNTGAYDQGDIFNASTYEFNKNGSLVAQIAECDGAGACQQPIVFNWQIGTVLNTQTGSFINNYLIIPAPGQILAVGDVDGDGVNDIAYVIAPTPMGMGDKTVTGTMYIGKGTGAGFTTLGAAVMTMTKTCTIAMNGSGTCTKWSVPSMHLADVNGDGKADLIWNNQVRLSNGSGFNAVTSWISNVNAKIYSMADIDGNGRSDVLYQISVSTPSGLDTITTTTWYYGLSTGVAFTSAGTLGTKTVRTKCIYFGGTTCSDTLVSSSGILGGVIGDFDGDGLADLAYGRNVYKSTGSGFGVAVAWLPSQAEVVSVGDYDGNGVADVAYISPQPASINRNFNLGVSDTVSFKDSGVLTTQQCILSGLTCSSWPAPIEFIIKDLNYDSLGELIGEGPLALATGSVIKPAATTNPDLLVGINQGLGNAIAITNQKLSAVNNSVPVYVSDSGSAAVATYPNLDILKIFPQYVVSAVTMSDDNGGVLTNNYNYGGLKAHLTGRGSLGFRYQKVSQVDADADVTTFFRQDYPYIGLPSQTEKRITSTSALIGASVLSYANTPLATGSAISQFPYLSQSVEQNFELSGALINTITTSNQYDSYGNATQISVNSNDGYIKTTTNTYSNDSTNWLLGRLLRSTVTSTTP